MSGSVLCFADGDPWIHLTSRLRCSCVLPRMTTPLNVVLSGRVRRTSRPGGALVRPQIQNTTHAPGPRQAQLAGPALLRLRGHGIDVAVALVRGLAGDSQCLADEFP